MLCLLCLSASQLTVLGEFVYFCILLSLRVRDRTVQCSVLLSNKIILKLCKTNFHLFFKLNEQGRCKDGCNGCNCTRRFGQFHKLLALKEIFKIEKNCLSQWLMFRTTLNEKRVILEGANVTNNAPVCTTSLEESTNYICTRRFENLTPPL